MTTESFVFGESPAQAARAISDALVYLQQEAEALGMCDVSKLIREARAKTGKYRLAH